MNENNDLYDFLLRGKALKIRLANHIKDKGVVLPSDATTEETQLVLLALLENLILSERKEQSVLPVYRYTSEETSRKKLSGLEYDLPLLLRGLSVLRMSVNVSDSRGRTDPNTAEALKLLNEGIKEFYSESKMVGGGLPRLPENNNKLLET